MPKIKIVSKIKPGGSFWDFCPFFKKYFYGFLLEKTNQK
jgi:hypothetical protein